MSTQSPEWTLEYELRKLAKESTLAGALKRIGLSHHGTSNCHVVPVSTEWQRGGAETYIYKFNVEGAGPAQRCLLKACVAFSPALSVEEILHTWVKRRKLLESAGAHVPHLYYSGEGLLVEERIEYTLAERLHAHDLRPELLQCLGKLLHIFASLGFAGVAPFADLMSRGADVVCIDFGVDLGAPQAPATHLEEELFSKLFSTISSWGIKLSSTEIVLLRTAALSSKEGDPRSVH